MGGRDHAGIVSVYEGRAFRVPTDLDRNTVGFPRHLRTTLRRRGKNHERDRRLPHRRGVSASLRERRGRISAAGPGLENYTSRVKAIAELGQKLILRI